MLEKSRQLVIFGNYNLITIEKVVEYNNKYNLNMTVQMQPDVNNIIYPITSNVLLRPVLVNNNKSIFFGSSRIHIQELDAVEEKYEEFYDDASKQIKQILEFFVVHTNRLAVNGTVLFDCNKNEDLFNKYIKLNGNITTLSNEWMFRINNNEIIDNVKYNKIMEINRGTITDNNGKFSEILAVSYDYNTVPVNYNLSDKIDSFIKMALEFRNSVVK